MTWNEKYVPANLIYISCPIMFYPTLSCPIMSYHDLSYPIMSYHVLSCPVLPYYVLVLISKSCMQRLTHHTELRLCQTWSLTFFPINLHHNIAVPGADHILAQPLKRCSASRIRPNETFKLAKKRRKILCFGLCGRKDFFRLSPSYKQSPENRENLLCPTVLQLRWDHFDMVRWKYDSVCISSMLRDTLELILWKKADKKYQDQKRSIFFAKGALIGKSVFQTQRINAVHGRCSSSDVLGDIPSNFTRSVRRRIVL